MVKRPQNNNKDVSRRTQTLPLKKSNKKQDLIPTNGSPIRKTSSVIIKGSVIHREYHSNSQYEANLKSFLDRENINCIVPFKYDHKNMTNFPMRMFLGNETDVLKLYLSGILAMDLPDLNFRENIGDSISKVIEDRFVKNCFRRTLSGWDDQGIHYWLSKMNGSDRFIRETGLPYDPLMHVHACKECMEQVNMDLKVCTASSLYFPISNNTQLFTCSSLIYNGNQFPDEICCDFLKKKCNGNTGKFPLPNPYDEDRDETLLNQSRDQYFKRLIYSHNSCSLNYKFPEVNEKGKEKTKNIPGKQEPQLNPNISVVVYGTDPCALNFPVELEGKESEISGGLSNCSSYKSVPHQMKSTYLKENIFSGNFTNNIFCETFLLADNKHVRFDLTKTKSADFDSNSSSSSYESISVAGNISKIYTLDNSNFGIKKRNSNSNINRKGGELSHNFKAEISKDRKMLGDAGLCKNVDRISGNNSATSLSNYTTVKSLSESDVSSYSETASNKLVLVKPSFSDHNSALSKIISQFPASFTKTHFSQCPLNDKTLELTVYDCKFMPQKNMNPVNYPAGRKSRKKRKVLHRPEIHNSLATPIKVRLISLASNGKKILLGNCPSSLALGGSEADVYGILYEFPLYLQLCIYIMSIILIVSAYAFLEDTLHYVNIDEEKYKVWWFL